MTFYDIKHISTFQPDARPLYFLDANVWIICLHPKKEGYAMPEKAYLDFFEKIVEFHLHKAQPNVKKPANYPKFVMTSMLLGEIVNAYMRQVAMRIFYETQGSAVKDKDFKRDYRKTDDYQKQLKLLVSNLKSYEFLLELHDDNFEASKPFDLLDRLQSFENCDFNDFYYFQLLKSDSIPIVTHDGDFRFLGIEILTEHPHLLRFA